MSRHAYIRASLILAATQHFPKRVRDTLISNAKFSEDLITDAVVSFGSGISFQRSILFDAVRRAFDSDIAVNDTCGDVWRVEFLREEVPPKIALAKGKKQFLVNHLVFMSPDRDTRISLFRDEANRVNLPPEAASKWEVLLEARPPNDDELGDIQDDLNDTPIVVRNTIQEQLARGTASIDRLVPRSVRYYERVVGRYEEGLSFDNYVARVAMPHMERLVKWRTFEGYQLALLLSSQPTLSAALGTLAIQSDELSRICDWLAVEGDVISRTAAVEIGLSRFKSDAPLQEPLSRLVRAVALVEHPQPCDRYKLLSALIIVVYGELARTRVLASKPPFWRRMAAVAQAALIERCFVAVGGDTTEFADWAISARWKLFLLQCYVDLRTEPRWLPELVLPQQLRNEFGGRVWMAANNNNKSVNAAGWAHLLLDDAEGSVRGQISIPQAYLPGPLEGGFVAQMEIPAEHQAEMRADLSAPVIKASSFYALVNGSLVFRIPVDLADKAAEAIARADYRLDCGDDGKVLIPILLGLATVAAITRNHQLTDSLFTLLRKYRRFYPDELGIEESFRIGMIASASRVEISDWCQCVGNCMTDLAFQPIEQNEAVQLHSQLVDLCHLVPELWATCGQAEAALRSVLNI